MDDAQTTPPPGNDAGTGMDATTPPPGNDASVPDSGTPDTNPPPPPPDANPTACATHGYSGPLATFSLGSQPGSETSASVTSTGGGVTASALSRSSGLTSVSGAGSINSSGWSTNSSADPSLYYTLSITPGSNCTVTVTTVAYDLKASTTGPSKADLATSADNFASHGASFAATGTGNAAVSSATSSGPLEIRVYGYGASSSSGTLRIENSLVVNGTIN